MDSLTHLAAGAVIPLAFRAAPRRTGLILFGIIAGEFPDIDMIAGFSPQSTLGIHRVMTHSIPAIILASILLTIVFRIISKRTENLVPTVYVENGRAILGKPKVWGSYNIWLIAFLALVSHVYLDCMTTFGTGLLWPFSSYRIGLPALFIVDPLFTGVLLILLVFCLKGLTKPENIKRQVKLARLAILWMVLYPLVCLGINFTLENKVNTSLAVTGESRINRVKLSTMPLAPFFWKVIGENNGEYRLAKLSLLSPFKPLGFGEPYQRVEEDLWGALQKKLPLFRNYANFVSFPVYSARVTGKGFQEITFQDLRYVPADEADLQSKFGRGDGMFMFQVLLDTYGQELHGWRYLKRGNDKESDEGWNMFIHPLFLY